ncbi:MAG TPA: adenine deaminase [Syntrophorhabdaceae bacterium]|nr:adenine deaminase [Syntrophorhabdaceae bacterium]HNT68430.1 adenine deaminase [Syntrophorhabdaceae bacterium]
MEISANIVDIFNGAVFPGTIEIKNGVISRIAKDGGRYDRYIMPGFIDAHVHIESSMLVPGGFARLAVRHGTVATVSDPHEIANVLGIEGVRYMIENGSSVPFKFFFGASPCVPATKFETAGAALDPGAVEALLQKKEIRYLSEMMNFPGVINNDPDVMAKIALAKRYKKPVDGHAPGLRGEGLEKYIRAGISTDHESFTYDEGKEKISLGMNILVREGSAAKNFDALSPLIAQYPSRCMLCSDDLHPDDLVGGHINRLVKRACGTGIDTMTALRCACLNPVLHYNLDVGLLREGDGADFIEVDNLSDMNVLKTYIRGMLVAENGSSLIPCAASPHVNNFSAMAKRPEDFAVRSREGRINVIEAINDQVITGRIEGRLKPRNGFIASDTGQDILKLTVVNRYAEAPPAVAFVRNFGLKRGAIAASVAHDSHNIIAVGVADEDICSAVNAVIMNKGGLSVAYNNSTETLPLPVAGLMTDEDGHEVARQYSRLSDLAKQLGSSLRAPFMTLSFMALLVIPKLKLSDRGLFDGEAFTFTGLDIIAHSEAPVRR